MLVFLVYLHPQAKGPTPNRCGKARPTAGKRILQSKEGALPLVCGDAPGREALQTPRQKNRTPGNRELRASRSIKVWLPIDKCCPPAITNNRLQAILTRRPWAATLRLAERSRVGGRPAQKINTNPWAAPGWEAGQHENKTQPLGRSRVGVIDSRPSPNRVPLDRNNGRQSSPMRLQDPSASDSDPTAWAAALRLAAPVAPGWVRGRPLARAQPPWPSQSIRTHSERILIDSESLQTHFNRFQLTPIPPYRFGDAPNAC